jgi:hypothetical protein
MMAPGDPSQQVVESCLVIALYSLILGDVVNSEHPVDSCCIISFCRQSIYMFLASVDHIWEMLSARMNLDDACGVWFVTGFEPQRYLFESERMQVSVSLSKPHHIPPKVEEG